MPVNREAPKKNNLKRKTKKVIAENGRQTIVPQTERLFRSIVENSQAGIFTVDNAFRFTYGNDRLCQILGYSRDEIIGHDFREFLDEESKKLVVDRYVKRQQGQEVPPWYEFVIVKKSGELRNVDLSATVIRDSHENAITVGQILDITERKRSEKALRQSEEHYKTLFDSTNDAVFIHDLDGNFLDVNPVACERLGYSYDELMQKKVIDIDTPEFATLVENRISELRTKGQFVAETAHVTKDGKVIPTEISSRIIQHYGVPAILTAARDITERKKAQTELQKAYDELEDRVDRRTADLRQTNLLLRQEIAHRKETEEKLRQSEVKYRDLVESATSVVLEMDKNGNVIFINKFGLNYFGYSESELLGRNVVGTIVPETDSSGKDLQALIHDILQDPNKYSSSENENMRKNGERVWVAWTNKSIYNPESGEQEVLCIGIDRTEQKQSQERLAEEIQERVAAEERNSLARDLHDAVSQTLFSASLIAEVLPRLWERNRDEGKKRLEEVRQLSRGALAEMRMLLLELRPATLTEANLGDLLKQVSDAAVSKLGVPVTLTVEGQGTLPPQVQIAFYRVAQEALNNIQKHASAKNVSVKLGYLSGSVYLTICDDGIGFDPVLVSAHHMGLSIMKERSSAAGAGLDIYSETGKGTQITMVWPAPVMKEE